MPKKTNTWVNEFLFILGEIAKTLPLPLETPYEHVRRVRHMEYKEYYDAVYQMKKRGMISIEKRDGKNYISLTKEGVLETLLAKADVKKQKEWDGKWRVLIFDIPEDNHLDRDRLRHLLKRYGFKKLQASVFIHAYPLNREALSYLKETGLNKFIRIMKVEEMDNDADLKVAFNLK